MAVDRFIRRISRELPAIGNGTGGRLGWWYNEADIQKRKAIPLAGVVAGESFQHR